MDFLFQYKDEDIYLIHLIDQHPKSTNFLMHAHDVPEIYCFLRGAARYWIEGRQYPLAPNSLMVIRQSETHRLEICSEEQPYERFAIHFSPRILATVDPAQLLLAPFYNRPLGRQNLYLPEVFPIAQPHKLLHAMCNTSVGTEQQRLTILSYFFPLLEQIRLVFAHGEKDDLSAYASSHNLVEEVVLYINEHLFEELSLTLLGKHFYLSISHLNRIFRAATGSSIHEYILVKRLIAAREYIQGGKGAGAAALLCGFQDYSSFYRAYVRRFGVSPKADFQA